MAAFGLRMGGLFREPSSRNGDTPVPLVDPATYRPIDSGAVDEALVVAFHAQLLALPERLTFLTEHRGLSREVIDRYAVGFDGERYTIAIRDATGAVRNIRRYRPGGDPKMLPWRKGYGTRRLFPVQQLVPDGQPIMVARANSTRCAPSAGTCGRSVEPVARGRGTMGGRRCSSGRTWWSPTNQ